MNQIYAISTSKNIRSIIGDTKNFDVHSSFQNGLNLIGDNGLVFIGTMKNGELPFGIHLNDEDTNNLINNDNSKGFIWDKEKSTLISGQFIINLSKSRVYDSHLNIIEDSNIDNSIKYLTDTLLNVTDDTGFDEPIKRFISSNKLISDIQKNLKSNNTKEIEASLRSLIGRGRGLTPSGDDFLIGLLWVNRIRTIIGKDFYTSLMTLSINESLTTDISINYYKEAFKGNFSSPLINLYNSLIHCDKIKINFGIEEVFKCGHTSGIDTLAGIVFGLKYLIGGN